MASRSPKPIAIFGDMLGTKSSATTASISRLVFQRQTCTSPSPVACCELRSARGRTMEQLRYRRLWPWEWGAAAALIRAAFPISRARWLTDGVISYYLRERLSSVRVLERVARRGLLPARPLGIVGVVLAELRESEGCGWLELIAVAPSEQGRGHGARLVGLVEAATSAAGASRLELAVDAENDGALRLYERLGYAVVGPAASPGVGAGPHLRYGKDLVNVTAAPELDAIAPRPKTPRGLSNVLRRVAYKASALAERLTHQSAPEP